MWRSISFALIGFIGGAVFQAYQLFDKYGSAFDPSLGMARMAGSGIAGIILAGVLALLTRPKRNSAAT